MPGIVPSQRALSMGSQRRGSWLTSSFLDRGTEVGAKGAADWAKVLGGPENRNDCKTATQYPLVTKMKDEELQRAR